MNRATITQAPALARGFCRVLRSWLTPDELEEAVTLNRSEPDPGVCHSHDHCDANMAMSAAFEELRLDVFNDEGQIDDDTCAVWNRAWDLAKKAEFNADNVKE